MLIQHLLVLVEFRDLLLEHAGAVGVLLGVGTGTPALPHNRVLALLLDQPDTLQYVGDVVYSPLLPHRQLIGSLE